MFKGTFLFILFWLFDLSSGAQSYTLSGRITNSRMEPLPMVSVSLKNNPTATITNNKGNYKLELPSGSYELVVTMVGYKSQAIVITLAKDSTLNLLLEEESKGLEEVVVKARIKDKAEEIIRTLIQHKENILAAPGAYSSKVYIRATQQDSGFGRGKQSKKALKEKPKSELDKMAMAEVLLHLDCESDNRIKEERLGVKKRGDSRQLFFLSATEGNFSLYHNLIKVPAISSMPFLSPVSYSGLVAYKLKTLKTDRIGKYKVYTISFKPRQLTNATVEGELVVSDSSWSILYAKYSFPKYHLHEYEYFEVEQNYEFVQNKAWMLNRQQFTYFSRGAHAKFSGQTVATYTDYELNKQFSKQHFGSEISSTNQEAYEKDSTFWQTVRKEPLSPKELRFIQYQDSVYRVTHSDKYLDSLERVINKITWKKIGVFGQSFYNRKKDHYWHLPPVISLYQPVGFGGSRINITLSHLKTYRSRKNFSFFTNVSYGIRNSDVNGSISINRLYNPFSRGYYHVSAGRDFQYIYEGDAWINMLKRNNIYLNNSIGVGHGLELANGLFFSSDLDMSFRRSVSGYKTSSVVDSVLGDVLKDNQAVAFEPYNALYGKLRLQYTPKQRYTREPREKIILGSRWPTFYAQW
ncbi:MAG TPA: DUF5686 and carboxypeptidase regulatory-like domain-containing protein, partial [Chitinophagaceae bacterium]|nr:DUF5686 and carboxypeptidase regulatory-like domain-containing protein [Chitinophagaceae bacterium]